MERLNRENPSRIRFYMEVRSMMQIIIPYREANNGLELRYALRSIDKYLKIPFDNIYLIGLKFPDWLRGVEFIHCGELRQKSSFNILNKVWAGLIQAGPTCIQWNDDIYLTHEVNDIPYYAEGTLETALDKSHGNYRNLILNTALQITEKAPYFDVHTPIIYERKRFKKLFDYDWGKKTYLVKSLYGYVSKNPAIEDFILKASRVSEYTDCKISGPMTKDEIKAKIAGSTYFSTSPQGMSDTMVEVLNELYPEPSKYEQ